MLLEGGKVNFKGKNSVLKKITMVNCNKNIFSQSFSYLVIKYVLKICVECAVLSLYLLLYWFCEYSNKFYYYFCNKF